MIYLTRLIYLHEGKEDVFKQFEEMAIPIISKYNGRLTLRIRPDENSVIERNIEQPYEIHLIEFDTQEDFDEFRNDETRKEFFHLKEMSVRSSLLVQGTRLN